MFNPNVGPDKRTRNPFGFSSRWFYERSRYALILIDFIAPKFIKLIDFNYCFFLFLIFQVNFQKMLLSNMQKGQELDDRRFSQHQVCEKMSRMAGKNRSSGRPISYWPIIVCFHEKNTPQGVFFVCFVIINIFYSYFLY